VPTVSSDSDGSIDDIVFDNTGMCAPRFRSFLAPIACKHFP
jgi:hypothetical protein